jgi:ADP-heptose:LPS heptosyltransferase
MRILALQLKRIGDAILTAPALAGLRAALPGARVELVLAGASGGLAEMFRGTVSAVHTMHSGKWNVGVWREAFAGKWDAVIDFSGTDRSASLGLVTRAPVRLGYQKHATNKLRLRSWTHLCTASVRELHTVDFHHALVNSLLELHGKKTIPQRDPGHLHMPAGVTLPPRPAQYVVVHPGTARPEKYWPAERWVQVIEAIQEQHHLPVILTGSNDPDETAHLKEIHGKTLVWGNFAGTLDLLQTAAVLRESRLILGVDSAAMHLAAGFHKPQIALFGPTNPYHWRPRHDLARVLLAAGREHDGSSPRHTKAPMEELPAARVLAAAAELLHLTVAR